MRISLWYSIEVMTTEATGRLSGKSALITGATRGIGRAIAAAFAAEGARVFICGRHDTDLRAAVQEIRREGGEIDGRTGDVGRSDDIKQLVRAAADRYGAIDIVVNNASALGPRVPIAEYPEQAWEDVLRVNLTGLFLMTREVLQLMIPRRSWFRLSTCPPESAKSAGRAGEHTQCPSSGSKASRKWSPRK